MATPTLPRMCFGFQSSAGVDTTITLPWPCPSLSSLRWSRILDAWSRDPQSWSFTAFSSIQPWKWLQSTMFTTQKLLWPIWIRFSLRESQFQFNCRKKIRHRTATFFGWWNLPTVNSMDSMDLWTWCNQWANRWFKFRKNISRTLLFSNCWVLCHKKWM